MASTSIVVLEEFLQLGSSQTKKNSLTALSVIDSDESAKLIAKTALQDDDTDVRQRAVDEMLSLTESRRKTALAVIANGLTSEDQLQQQRAYVILGKFKCTGGEVPNIRMKWGNRMWLAASLYSSIYPQRPWWFRVRSWQPALLATAISTLPFLIFNLITVGGVATNGMFIALISLAGVILSVIATQFTTPIYLQLRPIAASFVQVLLVFLCTFLVGIAGAILLLVLSGGGKNYEFIGYSFVVFLLTLMASAVRMGTLLPFVAQFIKISRDRKYNLFIETVLGTIAGFSVVTLVYWVYRRDLLNNYNYYDPETRLNEYTAVWLAFLALIVGLAYSFAKIDTEVLSDRRALKLNATEEVKEVTSDATRMNADQHSSA